MKVHVETTARVISQKIVRPDPKNAPDLELGRVEMVVQSLVDEDTTATKAVLLIPKDWLWERFLLGRELLITITDSQQELKLGDDARRAPARGKAQASLTFSGSDGAPVTTTLDRIEESLGLKPESTKRQAAKRTRKPLH